MNSFEARMVDILIKMHKRNISMLFISGALCVAIIMMNFIIYREVGHISTLSAACSGMLAWNIVLCLIHLGLEKQDLKIEKERKAFYQKHDVEERDRMKHIGSLLNRMEHEK